MKNKTVSTVLSIIFLLVLVSLFFLRDKILPASIVEPQNVAPQISSVIIGGEVISVKIADTPALQGKGLSGTESLAAGEGMLFVFDKPDAYAFWMKDMNYPIDIIWLTDRGTPGVVDIKHNATPESYPQTFKPRAFATYVLEVPSGYASAHGIEIYDEVSFQ